MTTVFNPLTNRYIKDYGSMGKIIKNIQEWNDINTLEKSGKKMLSQYRLKNKNWKTDFLKIVEYYHPDKIQEARMIADNINLQERQRAANIRIREETIGHLFMEYLSYIKETKKSNEEKIKKFLDEKVISKTECECAICLNFEETSEKIVELSCRHNYHYNCISQWISDVNNCPMCKKQCF
jgi:hypothetical protein